MRRDERGDPRFESVSVRKRNAAETGFPECMKMEAKEGTGGQEINLSLWGEELIYFQRE